MEVAKKKKNNTKPNSIGWTEKIYVSIYKTERAKQIYTFVELLTFLKCIVNKLMNNSRDNSLLELEL